MDQNLTTPTACDCHVHVIGPKRRFPLAAARTYTPMDAPVAALEAMLARLSLGRVVIVQPSVYGTDNSCLLDALARLGDRARGVAVLPDEVPNATLDDLHGRGVRGLRVNVASLGTVPVAELRARLTAAAALCARNGWHVQTFIRPEAIEPLASTLQDLPVPVVIDHFGLIAPMDLDGGAARALCRLLAGGRIWVKLSAAYRIAADPAAPRVGPLARRLADANPERVVWGSDWPHTPPHAGTPANGDAETPYRDLDTRALLRLVDDWLPEPRRRRQLLADNPARLYGFA